MRRSPLSRLPAVERILLALGDTGLPRPAVVALVRRELLARRKANTGLDFESVLARVRDAMGALRASRIRVLINGTGVLVHTNFGRAPLGLAVVEALSRVGGGYSNLEYGLPEGGRGARAAYLEHNLAVLCGAEAATAVNNNAAALVLILRHFCGSVHGRGGRERRSRPAKPRNEVVISRGELVQIGGGFRIPEILEASGAALHEVGTTNKTSLEDYARGVSASTALILKVHRSNFFMDGFVASPSTKEIAALARKRRVPFVEDLGSGAVTATEAVLGLEHEPTPAEVLRQGVDLVCFSGDKLLGGPQAGLVAGRGRLVAALKREPFFRALRCDKLILSALEAVVDSHLRIGSSLPAARESSAFSKTLPLLGMIFASNEELHLRAEAILASLAGLPLTVTIGAGQSQVGGGALPRSAVPSVTLEVAHDSLGPQEVASRLRERDVPVVGYVARGRFKLDLRTVFPDQDLEIVAAIRSLAG